MGAPPALGTVWLWFEASQHWLAGMYPASLCLLHLLPQLGWLASQPLDQ